MAHHAPKKQRILVTGGAGFIGSHLCRALLAEGHSVICLDNLSTGSKANIRDLQKQPLFSFLRRDVTQPLRINVGQIYHLACPASPRQYQADPVKTLQTSVLGTMQMLELAKRTKARMLFASTSEVYGDPTVHPQTEEYWGNVNPIGIRSCYDEGKRCAETLCFDYHRQYTVDIRLIRIFNTFGPNMAPDDGRVVSNFVVQALSNKNITIYGTGTQTRSLQYIDDLIVGMQRMMHTTKTIGPVNLGNPHEQTILQLAKRILKMVPDSTSRIVFRPLPPDDPRQRKPDISLAKKLLGWTPKVPVEEGLAKTITYFAEQMKNKKL